METVERMVDGAPAADARSHDDGGFEPERLILHEIDAGIRNRFSGRDQRELRVAVVDEQLAFVEALGLVVVLHLGGDLDVDLVDWRLREAADAALAGFERRPDLGDVVAQRRNAADAGDRDANGLCHAGMNAVGYERRDAGLRRSAAAWRRRAVSRRRPRLSASTA